MVRMAAVMAYIWWVMGGLLMLLYLAPVSSAHCVVPSASETYITSRFLGDTVCKAAFTTSKSHPIKSFRVNIFINPYKSNMY